MKNLTLGQLITALQDYPADLLVRFDWVDGQVPGEFCSWRGRYDELSLEPAQDDGPALPYADVLLAAASVANGAAFDGYKGGEYTMGWNTPLWADPWGTCPGRAITGIHVKKTTLGDTVVLTTAMLNI